MNQNYQQNIPLPAPENAQPFGAIPQLNLMPAPKIIVDNQGAPPIPPRGQDIAPQPYLPQQPTSQPIPQNIIHPLPQ